MKLDEGHEELEQRQHPPIRRGVFAAWRGLSRFEALFYAAVLLAWAGLFALLLLVDGCNHSL